MHEFEGRFEDTKREVIAMSKRYTNGNAEPNANDTTVPDPQDDDENEEEMSGVERLLKRRRLSGDISVRQRSTTLSEVELEEVDGQQ